MSRSTRRIAGVAIAGACVAALAAPALAAPTAGPDTSKAPGKTQIDIQILSFNDFHGNLEPPSGSSGRITIDHFYTDVEDIDGDARDAAGGTGHVSPLIRCESRAHRHPRRLVPGGSPEGLAD